MRRAARVDGNHAEVVAALRAVGARVLSLAAIGHGVPDLLVYHAGIFRLVEIKDGSKPPSERKLTPDQVAFHRLWPVAVVTGIEEAMKVVGLVRV